MTNREALTLSLAKLGDRSGWEAEIQAAYTLVDELDAGNTVPEVFREYRTFLKVIRAALEPEEEPDALDKIIAELSTKVRDTEDGPAHARAEVRGNS